MTKDEILAKLAAGDISLQEASKLLDEKVVDEAVRENDEKYKILVNTSPDGVIMTDVEGRVLFASERVREMHGSAQVEDLLGKSPFEFIAPEDHQRFRENLAKTLEEGVTRDIEYSLVRKDGTQMPGEVSAAVVRDTSGKPTAITVILRDITERKQAQEALQQAHDELQAVYDGITDGIIVADIETKQFVRCNERICQMLGYSMEELNSLSVMDIHPQEDLEESLEGFQGHAEGRLAIHENRPTLRKDGSVFYADITTSRITYKGRPCLVGFFRDITRRKQTLEDMQQLHDQLHAVCDGMTDGLLIADVETKRFVMGNAAICEMLGYSEDELLSRSITDIHPAEDLPAILNGFQAQVEGRLVVYENAPVVRKDGSVLYADIGARTMIFGGRPSAIGIFRDITERKRAQEALERERRTLKHLLQSSDHERQLIAYEIHDSLAQQVAGALMQFETYDDLKQANPEDAARAFDAGMTMLRQGHYEARRLIAGVRPPILDESGVVPAVAHLVHEQSRPEQPKIELHSKIEFDRLVPVLENAIYRITQEGLSNACKHSKSETVKISLLQQADQLRIEVRDWGIGFDPEQVTEGCYGLAGIRERARMLGGKCSIDSTIGKGTRIQVDLPVMPRNDS